MVERVEQALREELWKHGSQLSRQINRDLARAAIAAMREPTDQMFATAAHSIGGADRVRRVWGAMVDAALNGGE
jgi:hypothetical protein